MKSFYFSVIFVISFGVQCAQCVGHGQLSIDDRFEKVIRKKCETNSDDKNAFLEFIKAAQNLPNCAKHALGDKIPSPIEDFEGYCNHIKSNNYYNCIKELTDKLGLCLGKEEAYLPDFVLSTFNASLEEFCENDGANKVTELLNVIENDPCLSRGLRTILFLCFKDLRIVKKFEETDYVIERNDICGDFETISKCTNEAVLEHCKKDYSKYVTFLFKPYLDWCKLNP